MNPCAILLANTANVPGPGVITNTKAMRNSATNWVISMDQYNATKTPTNIIVMPVILLTF